ncbi:MAG TPA: bifunctional helix-turn-helix transcriptional regulator/GNAT family N-acetyltransferase [Chitinophagaceae bacterium]|nr:bifunctional helix-turn-helix transcriptional regulator/GNAT family N-acetyltransferase [Chitinophagaceae bacterium]
MAIGTRLRKLGESITEDAAHIYKLYDVQLQPRWFPVFYVLSQGSYMAITAIANEIRHSHVSVSQIVKEMKKRGLVVDKMDHTDARKTLVALSNKGKREAEKIQDQYRDVGKAVEAIFNQSTYDLWKAIEEWEHLLEQKTLLKRVIEQRKVREQTDIKLVPYSAKYRKVFKDLNAEWISKYFKMEEADLKYLDHPETNILKKGGYIAMALYKNQPVGTCALVKMDKDSFELAKMAVSPKCRGKGIGYLLCLHAIDKAKELGGKKIYLESNTLLKPAIDLYYKAGFQKVARQPSPYERCNIQMERIL